MPFARAGLLVGDGSATLADLNVIRQARLEALKLRAIANPASDVPAYQDTGVRTFLVQLLSPEPGERLTSPQKFVDYFAPAVEEFVQAGVCDFEVHGEPNLPGRGYGISWVSPTAFCDWFVAVARTLKTTFGSQVQVGFPGLASSPAGEAGEVSAFLRACADAVQEADFVCCHVHWDSAERLRAFDGGMRFIRQYLETFPTIPLVVSEFANVNPNTHSGIKGNQYAEFYFTCAQYDGCYQDWAGNSVAWPRIQAAYAFLLRSSDPAYASQVWMDADGQPRPVVARVAARAALPHPTAMRFTWPTEFRYYTQFYGENQQNYYDHSYNHSLHGGHNGADLHVKYHDPESSPIRACLGGVVTRKKMSNSGYGHHIYIASQVSGVGRVTLLYAHMSHVPVEEGQSVRAGDVIGFAGMTGATSGPHLHLSLKIEGTNLPANADYLNPRPYLDPPLAPRGQPRVPYPRTYVLLPPEAGAIWAQAVVDATWDTHRFTIGGSADDAGIGDLDFRRVVAVNPAAWGDDLRAFFETHYPSTIYVPVEAGSPDVLRTALEALPEMPAQLPPQPASPRGQPRAPYARTYVLLPPGADAAWARGVVKGAWNAHRFTIGGSADDAGIGDLDVRRVIAVNPAAWGGDGSADLANALRTFFETHYPGVLYVCLVADTPRQLAEQLGEF
ncbi:MAG: M23 family metallopeptidase [Chloroflexota bacterium]|nr:M23 family metallopeptidase [Chloroflexota bacterium]